MPTNYPGNPAGDATTSPDPAEETIPAADLPIDGEAADADSVNQAFKTTLDWLAYRTVGRQLGNALGGGATSFDGPANPAAWNDLMLGDGAPISALDVLPTFVAGTGFAVVIGPGSGYLYTAVGIQPGESLYRTIWWAGQNKTLANPDPTNPRIDAVTVTPAAFGTPSTVAVVTGTPAPLPMAPAVASGSAAIFYVLVPAAASDSSHFRASRGLWRRTGYPWAGMTGVVAGCELSWNYVVDPTTTDAGMIVGAADQSGTLLTLNRVLIDGEPVEWVGAALSTTQNFALDSANNPFASPASSSFDKPYYVYAVGGRHNPMPSQENVLSAYLIPVTIVESLVAPNPKTGKPSANMTVNGVTVTPDGAVYIGLAFVVAGSTRRRGCIMDAEMTYSLNAMQQIVHGFTSTGREDMGTFTGGSQPSISTKMVVGLIVEPPAVQTAYRLYPANTPGQATPFVSFSTGVPITAAASTLAQMTATIPFDARAGIELWGQSTPVSGSAYGNMIVEAMGYNHRVRRFAGI